ncbi:hypothetical protein PEL8287_02700 [Roseovarius litorisediminis]|uniref:Uncharacterized protein n=1 Tax=Roseovarius litorisediminis TaxID=1312363 RepID=A0A1Y5SXN0_9RHOB|nr:hypothetical protein [Roseovarius litorisediminis]SLN51314.1 hypothetical protein PEL8287_02700 [Roseovarius litorisediminis]
MAMAARYNTLFAPLAGLFASLIRRAQTAWAAGPVPHWTDYLRDTSPKG